MNSFPRLAFRIRILALASLALVATMALSANEEMKGLVKEVNGYKVELVFMNGAPMVGKNQMMIRLSDSMMAPVDGAMVSATAKMDAGMSMGGSSMSEGKSLTMEMMAGAAGSKKGEYMATVDFPNEGKWVVDASAKVGDASLPASFEVEVAKAGPNMLIVGGFIGIILLVIVVAAINKARSGKSGTAKA